jgi:hypothetical protein
MVVVQQHLFIGAYLPVLCAGVEPADKMPSVEKIAITYMLECGVSKVTGARTLALLH